MFRKNYLFDKFFLLPFVRIWLLFLLILSFTDHDHYLYKGNDYKSVAVEAIHYDHIDFPVSIIQENSISELNVQKNLILPVAVLFNLYVLDSIDIIPPQLNFQVTAPLIIILLNSVIRKNAP